MDHLEYDWEGELYSNSSNFVCWNKYGKGEVASFCQLPVSPVNHGQNTVSKIGDMSKVHESCLEDISGPAEILQIEGGLDVSTNMVEYSGTSEVEGKDLNMHIAILSEPAKSLAIDYALRCSLGPAIPFQFLGEEEKGKKK